VHGCSTAMGLICVCSRRGGYKRFAAESQIPLAQQKLTQKTQSALVRLACIRHLKLYQVDKTPINAIQCIVVLGRYQALVFCTSSKICRR
jgi:hypothetical protein